MSALDIFSPYLLLQVSLLGALPWDGLAPNDGVLWGLLSLCMLVAVIWVIIFYNRSTQLEQSETKIQEDESTFRKKKDEWVKEEKQARAEIEKLDADYRKIREYMSDGETRKKLEAHKQEMQEIEGQLAELREGKKQAELEQEECAGELGSIERQLETKKQELRDEIKSYEAHLENHAEKLKSHGIQSRASCSELFEPAFGEGRHGLLQMNGDGNLDECTLLEEASERIARAGFKFSRRVLKAFHTSLKTGGHSPLTLLSGISGTGKSSLPNLYSKAMGVHFLNIPVAPTWDNFDFLIGYYSQLENNYRATELIRAMVQFERVERPNWSKLFTLANEATKEDLPDFADHDCGERLLLVLLDEMNLAHPERYWSDLASKLELRRLGGKSDWGIEIDTGPMSSEALRVFPSSNIFWVGTMNEDETTQQLSRKMEDRANIIRFAAPRVSFNSEEQGEIEGRESALTLETWEIWKRGKNDLLEHEQAQQNKWQDSITEPLAEMHLGLGHRVANAMQAYIANYPRETNEENDEWLKHAMADQIEMHIIPMLRGVDTSTYRGPLAGIHDIIQETGDEALGDAYGNAMNPREGTLFEFPGVSRSGEWKSE